MAYRNPLAWDRHIRLGLFKSDPNAQLPKSDPLDYEKLCMGIDLDQDFKEIDEMNAEMDRLYIQSLLMDKIHRVV